MNAADLPRLALRLGQGLREGNCDGMPAMLRLIRWKLIQCPLGLPSSIMKNLKPDLAARKRREKTG